MAEGGRYDLEMGPLGETPEETEASVTAESEAWAQIYERMVAGDDDATSYNSNSSSSLGIVAAPAFTSIEQESELLRNRISEMDKPEDKGHQRERRMRILRGPDFVKGSKWKFTQTSLGTLADLTFTGDEINDALIDDLHDGLTYGDTLPKIDKANSYLFMLGRNRSEDLVPVRITDIKGKLLSRSTIERSTGGKEVVGKLQGLNHYHESTGLFAEIRQQQENEAARAEEKKRDAAQYLQNIPTAIERLRKPQEQIQMQIMKPTPQRSNVVSAIEDIINSDQESMNGDPLNETLMTTLLNASNLELNEEFGEHDAREIQGLKLAERKMAETRGRLVSKIALLDEQYGTETDPVKREEIKQELVQEKRNLRYLNDEYESQRARIKRIWRDYIKKPDSKIPLKDRLKLLFKLEGFTIAAVITAIVMTFTTIGLAISNSMRGTGGAAPSPTPTPGPKPGPTPSPDSSITDRIREGLKQLSEWLKELAKKSLAALPGVIGSLVSFLLKTAGSVVGFMAKNVIMVLVAVIGSVVYGLVEGVRRIKPTKSRK